MADNLLSKQNCLSLVRILAAFQVMIGHLNEHLELGLPTTFTYFRGVPIFFAISGFLIWFSIERSNNYQNYLKKRFWRIYPELWIGVIIELISIIIFYDGWNMKTLSIFGATQGTILQFWTPGSLREYGCGTPNGTLWTMCVLIQFYIIAWFVHNSMHRKKILNWIIGFVVLIFVSIGGQLMADVFGKEIIIKLYAQTIIRYFWLFYIGCFMAEFYSSVISVIEKWWYAFFIFGFIPYIMRIDINAGYSLIWSVFLICGVIGFAYRYPQLKIKNDISYGLFIYHMIVINVFLTLGWIEEWRYAIAVMILSVIFALLSTITVGKWSANKKVDVE